MLNKMVKVTKKAKILILYLPDFGDKLCKHSKSEV
jgi:hypothetical protein